MGARIAEEKIAANFEKIVLALEAKHASRDRWSPQDCDPARRLTRYAAYFEGDHHGIASGLQRKGFTAKLARYKRYFDELDAGAPLQGGIYESN